MAKLRQKPGNYLERDRYATRKETLTKLRELWAFKPGAEELPLSQAAGRISGADVFSRHTLPVCRAAAADGVAVRFADFQQRLPDFSSWQENVDYAPADMGDDFDDAFDTVLWVEDFIFDAAGKILAITPEEPVQKGQLIRERGATLQKQEAVLKAGDCLNPFRMGLLAAAGAETVSVLRQPRLVYLPTGSELIPAGQIPARGQNIESNSLMVKALGESWGAAVECLPIVKDETCKLKEAFEKAWEKADILLLNGGTSMGTEDDTSKLLQSLAEYFQHGVRCIPGIPVAVAMVKGKPVVNLPGPPYAAFCALDWCVKGLVYHWYGLPAPERRRIKARLTRPLQKPALHEMYIRMELQEDAQGNYAASPLPMDIRYAEAGARWQGLFIAPLGRERWEADCEIEVELLYTDC